MRLWGTVQGLSERIESVEARRRLVLAGLCLYSICLIALFLLGILYEPATLFPHSKIFLFTATKLHRLAEASALEFAAIALVFAVEVASIGWDNSSIRQIVIAQNRSTLSDMTVFFVHMTPIFGVARIFLSFGIALFPGYWAHNFLAKATGIDLNLSTSPILLQVFCFFCLHTMFSYWQHRIGHSKIFWPLHRYHHSAEEFCVLNAMRIHPVYNLGITGPLFAAIILTVSNEALFLMFAMEMILSYVIHSRMPYNFGWVGRWVIQSPVHHRLHHKLDTSHPPGNLSFLPIWDRLFGTWQDSVDGDFAVGVSAPYRHGAWFVFDMARDYREFLQTLFGAPKNDSRFREGASQRLGDQELRRSAEPLN